MFKLPLKQKIFSLRHKIKIINIDKFNNTNQKMNNIVTAQLHNIIESTSNWVS
jgi:hypothetical protein